MSKQNTKSYSKFTFEDLSKLGLQTIVVDLFAGQTINPVLPTEWLLETLNYRTELSLDTEKARSEFIIAPILRELHTANKNVFSVYSGFNFTVDAANGLQGFCDFLLAKLPLTVVPESPIIAVVEAKLSDALSNAVPQCAAEMYAAKIWNEKKGGNPFPIYGTITTGTALIFNTLAISFMPLAHIHISQNGVPPTCFFSKGFAPLYL